MLPIGALLAVFVFALALALGGRAEREGAAVMAAALGVSFATGLISRPHAQLPPPIVAGLGEVEATSSTYMPMKPEVPWASRWQGRLGQGGGDS